MNKTPINQLDVNRRIIGALIANGYYFIEDLDERVSPDGEAVLDAEGLGVQSLRDIGEAVLEWRLEFRHRDRFSLGREAWQLAVLIASLVYALFITGNWSPDEWYVLTISLIVIFAFEVGNFRFQSSPDTRSFFLPSLMRVFLVSTAIVFTLPVASNSIALVSTDSIFHGMAEEAARTVKIIGIVATAVGLVEVFSVANRKMAIFDVDWREMTTATLALIRRTGIDVDPKTWKVMRDTLNRVLQVLIQVAGVLIITWAMSFIEKPVNSEFRPDRAASPNEGQNLPPINTPEA